MDAGINNVIYMELHSGPKMANSTCGKTIIAGTIDRGSTVLNIKQPIIFCNTRTLQLLMDQVLMAGTLKIAAF